MQTGDTNLRGRNSLPRLIAWLSLVMLAAACGPWIPDSIRSLWMIFGAFGLTAAVGLGVTRRIRALQKMQHRTQVFEERILKVLTPLAAKRAEASRIREAIRHIAEDYQKDARDGHERRFEPRIPVQIPAYLRPAGDAQAPGSLCQDNSSKVTIADFSSRGIRLSHEKPLDYRTVLVTFDLLDGHRMSLTAQLLWTQQQVDGKYASGGTVLELRPLDAHAAMNSRKKQELQQVSLTA